MRTSRNTALAALAAVLLCGAAHAQLVEYELDPGMTRVHWEVRHFGTSTARGRFDQLRGTLAIDRAARTGQAGITIDTASVSTGLAVFDSVIRGTDLLSSKDAPQAYFVASQFGFDGDRVAWVQGEFTLRGVSQPLRLQALRFACRPDPDTRRDRCGGDFEGQFRRSDFGMTLALPFVADTVRLVVQVEAVAR